MLSYDADASLGLISIISLLLLRLNTEFFIMNSPSIKFAYSSNRTQALCISLQLLFSLVHIFSINFEMIEVFFKS